MEYRDMKKSGIKVSSTAEYFAKNLQQVGFSSPTKAVLTTLKEAVDNSLDACEEHGILPDLIVEIEKVGKGSLKNTDQVKIIVEDNGPGIKQADVPMVFGEYLASSKFGKGKCSRGQQGIGISAATTWAMQTTAKGAHVRTKVKKGKAYDSVIQIDLKANKGIQKKHKEVKWDKAHGTRVEFFIDGRIQLNGEAGIIAFIKANILVNPHLTIEYKLPGSDWIKQERVSTEIPVIPQATEPHPHTMKLGEFLSHARVFGKMTVKEWLRTGFSRIGDAVVKDLVKTGGLKKTSLSKNLKDIKDADFKHLFSTIQETDLLAPSTRTVLSIGEEGLAKSILRLGSIDYFSVVTRKPTICDFKPVQIEVAIARLNSSSAEETVQVLRFANRVPLQFDKSGCAIVKAITSVNWKAYGLRQTRGQLPVGSYIIAVSVVSPFIKFKNASKETIDASEELVEEMRKALMQGGQRLGKHLRREQKEAVLESKIQHIEQFSPILVEGLIRITKSNDKRREKAQKGLLRILGRETSKAKKELKGAEEKLFQLLEKRRAQLGIEIVQNSSNEKEIEEFEKEESAEIKEIANAIARADAGEDIDLEPSKAKKTKKKVTKKKVTKKKVTKKKVTKKKVTKKKLAKKK